MDFKTKVFEAGVKNQLDHLENIVKKESIGKICKELDKLTKLKEVNIFLEYIFLGCDSDQDWASTKKAQLIIHCLELAQQKQATKQFEKFGDKILNKINDLIKCSAINPENLIKISNVLLQNIEKCNPKDLSWQYLLPTVYNKIRRIDKLDYKDDLIDETDYNAQILNKLLDMKWTQQIVVKLAEMFLELKLSQDETQKIVVKFTECIKWINPEMIPPLVQQLLQLTTEKSYYLLLKLQQYYGSQLYDCKSYVGSVYSESMTHNSDMDITSTKLIESEGHILSYISELVHRPIVQGYINYLRKANIFGVILHPFNLALLVMVANQHCMPELLDVVKTAIVRYYVDAELRTRCFYREMIAHRCDMETVIIKTMDNNKSNSKTVAEGMLKLTFVLLTSTVQIGQEDIVPKLCQLATFILIKIIENHADMIGQVIVGIGTSYFVGRNTALIIETFTSIAVRFKFRMAQNIKPLLKTFDDYLSLPDDEVNLFLEVMIELIKIRPSIKQIIIRQKHNSRADKHEIYLKLVIYHLKLLKYLQISSSDLMYEMSSSQGSVSTQISLTSSSSNMSGIIFSNEAICRDAISELHGILEYPLEAKQYLYKGLQDVVANNPELVTCLSMFVWEAFNEMPNRYELMPPICFDNLGKFIDNDWLPVTTISHMLMAMGLLLLEDDLEDHHNNFDQIATQMAKCEVEHFMLNLDVGLLDGSPEAMEQVYILHEAINSYDSFITYYFLSWLPQSENNEQMIINLFKARKRIVDFLRNYQKSKKKDANTTTTSTTNTTQTVGGVKKLNVPNSIIPLHCLDRVIQLLYCDHNDSVKWTGLNTGTLIKVLVPFHHYILESLVNTFQSTKQVVKSSPENIPYYKEHFEMIESFLFKYCVLLHDQLLEFDETTAELALDAFLQLQINKVLLTKEKYGQEMHNLLEIQEITSIDMQKLAEYIKAYKEILDQINLTDDKNNSLSLVVVNTIAFFADQIPITEKLLSDKLITWMKDTCRKKSIIAKMTANNFIACLINTSMRFTSSSLILRLVVSALGASFGWISDDVDTEVCEMAMVNASTSTFILQTIINEVKNHHDNINIIMRRIRLEYDYFALLKNDATTKDHQEVKRKERNVCSKLKDLVTLLTCLNYLSVPRNTHAQTELILKSTISIIKLLTTLANYFHSTSTAKNLAFQSANFNDLVRYTMKKLVPAVCQNIKAMEDAQAESRQTKQTKQKDVKSIPNVTLAIESFKKAVMQISVKTKIEVCDCLGTGSTRGFKIRLDNLQTIQDDTMDETDESGMSTISEADSAVVDSSSDDARKKRRRNFPASMQIGYTIPC